MAPPEPSRSNKPPVVEPSPVTVKLPLVLVRTIPFGPPVVETLVSETASGVVLLARVISTAAAPLVLMVPLVTVMVCVLSVANSPL